MEPRAKVNKRPNKDNSEVPPKKRRLDTKANMLKEIEKLIKQNSHSLLMRMDTLEKSLSEVHSVTESAPSTSEQLLNNLAAPSTSEHSVNDAIPINTSDSINRSYKESNVWVLNQPQNKPKFAGSTEENPIKFLEDLQRYYRATKMNGDVNYRLFGRFS